MEPMSLPALTREPFVSVLVANYNYGHFLPELVGSMLEQSYSNWELIICDDGSTDNSREILKRLSETDNRIKPLYKGNGGQGSAWNYAFEVASGEIISLLDADDWFRPDKLATVISVFHDNPNAGFVYHRLQPVDTHGKNLLKPVPRDLPSGWLCDRAFEQGGVAIPASTAVSMRREVAIQIFPIPVTMKRYSDGFVCAIAPFLTQIAASPEALTYYRSHGANHSGMGFTGPLDVQTYCRWVEGATTVFEHQKRFLAERFGSDWADRIQLRDRKLTWRYLAALYVLNGKPIGGVYGFDGQEILANLWSIRERSFWRVFFVLPDPVSRIILRAGYRLVWRIRRLARWFSRKNLNVVRDLPASWRTIRPS
jgi:glycosyltransferase involved in cell wall biosynthesis